MKQSMVDYYFERIDYHRKQRKGKGIAQTDLKKAQEDVKIWLKIK